MTRLRELPAHPGSSLTDEQRRAFLDVVREQMQRGILLRDFMDAVQRLWEVEDRLDIELDTPEYIGLLIEVGSDLYHDGVAEGRAGREEEWRAWLAKQPKELPR